MIFFTILTSKKRKPMAETMSFYTRNKKELPKQPLS